MHAVTTQIIQRENISYRHSRQLYYFAFHITICSFIFIEVLIPCHCHVCVASVSQIILEIKIYL